jgi:uncharacterized protein (TIGR02597 family)
MKLLRPSTFSVLVSFLAMSGLHAQNAATTDPVGFVTATIRGKSGANNANSFISLGMSRPTAFLGVVGTPSLNGSSQTVLTFSGTPFTANQFNGTANRHYLQLTAGPNSGLVTEVLATTANTLTLADNINDVLTANVTGFKVIPYWTLGTALPSGGGLNGGANATAADTVAIFNNGVPATYFYNTSVTPNQWRTGGTDASNVIIPPGNGLLVTRKVAGDVQLVIAGGVPLGATEALIGGGTSSAARNSVVSNPYPLASVTLANSGLAAVLTGGANATAADTVQIYNSSGVPTTYFYNTTVTPNQWRTGGTDASNVTIPQGAAIVINRKANRGSVEWYIPQPTMNLN